MGPLLTYVLFGCGRVELHEPAWGWPVGTTHYREGDDGEWVPIPEAEKKKTSWPTAEQYQHFWRGERKYAEGGWNGKRMTRQPPPKAGRKPAGPALYSEES